MIRATFSARGPTTVMVVGLTADSNLSARGPTAVMVVGLTVDAHRFSARGPTAVKVVGLTRNLVSAGGLAAFMVVQVHPCPRPMLCASQQLWWRYGEEYANVKCYAMSNVNAMQTLYHYVIMLSYYYLTKIFLAMR